MPIPSGYEAKYTFNFLDSNGDVPSVDNSNADPVVLGADAAITGANRRAESSEEGPHQSLQLNGESDSLGRLHALNEFDKDFTVSVWVKSESQSPSAANWQPVVYQPKVNDDQYSWAIYGVTDDSQVHAYVRIVDANNNTTTIDLDSGVNIIDGDWHHLVLIVDDDEAELYIDNVSVASDTAPNGGQVGTASGNIIIGGNDVYEAERFVGLVDDLTYYHSALGSGDVDDLFNN